VRPLRAFFLEAGERERGEPMAEGTAHVPGTAEPDRGHRHPRDEVVVEFPPAMRAVQSSAGHPVPALEIRGAWDEDGSDGLVLGGHLKEIAEDPSREAP